jgi:DNA-binding LacI/PurR family transcriptional regulator
MLRNCGIRGILLPEFDDGQGIAGNIPLPLEEFTIVGVGTRFEQPLLHYASDDQYECGRLAVQKLWGLGYRRIGYIGEPRIEKIVNGRFFAGYHATLQSELAGDAIPPLLSSRDTDVIPWLKTVGVEAVISASRHLLSFLRRSGVRVPDEVALAHLNVDDVERARPGEVSGIRQDNAGVGATAVELLVSLLYDNEVGVPLHPRGIQVHGTWVDGQTVRQVRRTKSRR